MSYSFSELDFLKPELGAEYTGSGTHFAVFSAHGAGTTPGLAGDIDIVGAGFFQRQPYEFAATLNAVPIIKLVCHGCSILRLTTEVFSQFVLGFFKGAAPLFRQVVAGTVDVEGQQIGRAHV